MNFKTEDELKYKFGLQLFADGSDEDELEEGKIFAGNSQQQLQEDSRVFATQQQQNAFATIEKKFKAEKAEKERLAAEIAELKKAMADNNPVTTTTNTPSNTDDIKKMFEEFQKSIDAKFTSLTSKSEEDILEDNLQAWGKKYDLDELQVASFVRNVDLTDTEFDDPVSYLKQVIKLSPHLLDSVLQNADRTAFNKHLELKKKVSEKNFVNQVSHQARGTNQTTPNQKVSGRLQNVFSNKKNTYDTGFRNVKIVPAK